MHAMRFIVGVLCSALLVILTPKSALAQVNSPFSLSVTADRNRVAVDEVITFTVQVENVSDQVQENVSVTNFLPKEFRLVSGTLQVNISELQPGQVEEFDVLATPVAEELGFADSITVRNEVELVHASIVMVDQVDIEVVQESVLAETDSLPETSSGYATVGIIAGLAILIGAGVSELAKKLAVGSK